MPYAWLKKFSEARAVMQSILTAKVVPTRFDGPSTRLFFGSLNVMFISHCR
jgi:hypothetical protein